jgi:hypothetical protein
LVLVILTSQTPLGAVVAAFSNENVGAIAISAQVPLAPIATDSG